MKCIQLISGWLEASSKDGLCISMVGLRFITIVIPRDKLSRALLSEHGRFRWDHTWTVNFHYSSPYAIQMLISLSLFCVFMFQVKAVGLNFFSVVVLLNWHFLTMKIGCIISTLKSRLTYHANVTVIITVIPYFYTLFFSIMYAF